MKSLPHGVTLHLPIPIDRTHVGQLITDPNHQNGRIFWLQRELTELPTTGRPLSQRGSLEEMYRIRKPLYEKFADYAIENSGSLDAVAGKIIQLWEECV